MLSVTHASDQRGGARSVERLTLKHPRAVRQGMGAFDVTALDGQPERSRTDPEDASGFVQIHPSFRGPSATGLAPPALHIVIHELDGIPLYNGDVEAAGAPPSVVQLRDAIRKADGLLIATPEYNHGVQVC